MPEVICTTVYQFPELSDTAKEKARSWYRELGPHDDWWDAVYEEFERVCEILGIRLKTTPVRLMGGGTRQKPSIWFSGFWSQGDGASFEGYWSHSKGAAARIRDYAPTDATLRGIAFQQTNILRDIAEDLARGRVYLPADELAQHDLTAAQLVAWSKPDACARFMQAQCVRAQRFFDESAALDAMVARDARATIGAMSALYREILCRIAANPQQAMHQRVRLSTFTKCSIALRARFGFIGSGA